jgi:DNA-binding winged helix-turn-helix (wHTH) protein/tetratricopeptide (TPR) repeat protein
MVVEGQEQGTLRFGLFEVDKKDRRLLKGGVRVKLQGQPFQVLTLLLERPGDLITREEIKQRLWPGDTFVEFDDGLNTAMRKLRSALGDNAENPRFIQTVPRQGYRFLAPVSLSPIPEKQTSAETKQADQVAIDREDSPQVTSPQAAPRLKSRWAWLMGAAVLPAVVLPVVIWSHKKLADRQPVSSKGIIVLADFANTTGDPVFSDALRQALIVELEQSPFLSVLSDRKMADTLKLMGRPASQPLTPAVAQEICARASANVMMEGSISSLGTEYLVGLNAVRCSNGDPIAHEQVEARRKEDIVAALGHAATKVRERLGESLDSMKKYDVALEDATTPSLEALQAYNLALKTWDKSGDEASVPAFKRAIALDPNFAMAYAGLGTIYQNLNEVTLSIANMQKAFDLRNRVTEAERFSIEARYYQYATGELEKAVEVLELSKRAYPATISVYNHLGTIQTSMGHYEKSLAEYREALRLDPGRAGSYGNAALTAVRLGRFDEATRLLAEAAQRKLEGEYLWVVSYDLAFLHNDAAQMKHSVIAAAATPAADALLLRVQANTEAYFGRMQNSHEFFRKAVDSALRAGDKEIAAFYLSETALLEAETGNLASSRQSVHAAMNLANGLNVRTLSALAMARIGDLSKAQTMADELAKNFPLNTMVQSYWLPTIHAAIELKKGNRSGAIELLQKAEPLELGAPPPFEFGTLYPIFIRGQVYLANNQGTNAAVQFKQMLDYPGITLNFPVGALARLGLGRAYALSNQIKESQDAYQAFFSLWKDADSEIPVLKQAKAEYATLQ